VIFGLPIVRDTGFAIHACTVGRKLRQAEIQNFCMTAVGDENIRGLDVAVHDAFGVGRIQAFGDVDANFEQPFELESATGNQVLESGTFHVLHDDEGAAVVLLNIVDGADVGMIQRGSRAGFALEAFQGLRIFGDVIRQELERHEAPQFGVLGFVHYAHATTAEFFDNPVLAESFADHCWILRWNLIVGAGRSQRICASGNGF